MGMEFKQRKKLMFIALELVTGKCAPLECAKDSNLVQWMQNKILTQEGLYEALDSRCGEGCKLEMIEVLKIAISCTNHVPASRPAMRNVVKWLEDIATKCS